MKKAITALLMAAVVLTQVVTTEAEGDTYIKAEYVSYCRRIGNRYGIAPELLEYLIEAESSGRADARSETGDIGLCQINLRYSRYTERQLLEPETNIRAAAEILSGLFEKYDIEGLMAYNTGEYSKTFKRHMQEGTMTPYARKIIRRSDQLQRLHERSRT